MLRAITIAGVALCPPSGVGGLIVMFFGDRQASAAGVIPGDVFLFQIGFAMFMFGLIGPFGFWSIHLGVETWVEKSGKWFTGAYGRGVSIAASVAYACLAVGIFTFALFPLLLFTPDQGDSIWFTLLLMMGGSICLAITVSAIAGGVARFRWWGVLAGVLVGAGFTILVFAEVWVFMPYQRQMGILLLVLSIVVFWTLRILAFRRTTMDELGINPLPD